MGLSDRKTTNTVKNQKQDLRLLLHLAPFIKPYKKVASIAGIALILGSIAFLLLGQGIKLFIDEGLYALDSKAMITILLVLLIMVVSTFVSFLFCFMDWRKS